MAESIVFTIILLFALSLYAYANYNKRMQIKQSANKNTDFFICVEAGDTPEVSAEELERKSFYDAQKCYIDENGKEIDISDMQCLVVNNNCMRKRKIKNGDRLLAQKIDIFKPVYAQINVNDILWINIVDTGKNKIRVLESIHEDGYLTTYYYDNNGEKKYSSRPHNISSVRGIVRYNLSL